MVRVRRALARLLFQLGWLVHPEEPSRKFPIVMLESDLEMYRGKQFAHVAWRDLHWVLEFFR